MSQKRSFTEYIFDAKYNEMYEAVDKFIRNNRTALELYSHTIDDIRSAVLSEIYVKLVTVDERPGNVIAFDVILDSQIEVQGKGSRDWESDYCTKWFVLSCIGTLIDNLVDFKILKTEPYNHKNFRENPLSDALVPYIRADELDNVAVNFLKKYYPEALKEPMALDTYLLAERMGLKVVKQTLTEDFSIFGQIFFADAETEVFDNENKKMIPRHFEAGTIVVDPNAFHLRNLGCVNNTIVHECVHWDKHRKAFELEKLYNASATQIKCIVVGGVKSDSNQTANDWMEWQANALAPRIQMPASQFKAKADECIQKHRNLNNKAELVDVMEPVIEELSKFFGVSKCAVKIRMVDIGFEEAVGAFTYIDGSYVKPHAFKKGSILKNQTYCISVKDAMYELLFNQSLRPCSLNGDLIYVDSHICVNDSKYVHRKNDGEFEMTEYGRLHIDECCLVFDLAVKHTSKYSEQFYKECVLYRDVNSELHFEATFSAESSKSVIEKAMALKRQTTEIAKLAATLPNVFSTSLVKLMEWSEISVEELAEKSKVSTKTIQRLRKNNTYNVPLKTVVAICIGMHLHPILSDHLIKSAGLSFKYVNPEHGAYHALLTGWYMHTIDECNELLLAQDYKRLSGDE